MPAAIVPLRIEEEKTDFLDSSTTSGKRNP